MPRRRIPRLAAVVHPPSSLTGAQGVADPQSGMRRLRSVQHDAGFTIVEVLVSATLLLVGILGVTTIVNTANQSTTTNKAREQGLALARELVESTRSIKYQALRPGTVTATVQAMPGFGDASGAAGWTIERRGITFSVSMGVCSVDDPGDGTGAHVANAFCANAKNQASAAECKALIGTPAKINGTGAGGNAADCGIDGNLDGTVDGLVQSTASSCPTGTSVTAGTCDAQPDDFKRIVVLITWDRGTGNRYVLQQATQSFPGMSAYSSIASIKINGAGDPPASGYVVKDKVSSVQFDVTSDPEANQVNWLLNGTDQGPIPGWSGTTGSFSWGLGNNAPDSETAPASGEVLDGSYTIGARVQDAIGIHGRELSVPVTLNRRIPFAPRSFYVFADSTGVTGKWSAPPDRDIRGYRMYRRIGSSTVSVCGDLPPTALTCKDPNPPSNPSQVYWATALDDTPSSPGTLRVGNPSITRDVKTPNATPSAPSGLSGVYTAGNGRVTLTWTSATDDAPPIQFYKIYRSTTSSSWSPLDQVDTVLPESSTQMYFETPTAGPDYYYWVSAVDSNGTEGPKVGPVKVVT